MSPTPALPTRAVTACPACMGGLNELLETLLLAQQHALYAGGRSATQAALDARHTVPGGRMQMRRCRDCGLEFALPLLAPSPDWYGALYGALPLYPALRWEYGQVLQALGASDSLLDHGCGSGHFLGLAAERVRRVVGVDSSPQGVAAVRQRGLEAHLAPAQVGAAPPGLSERVGHVTAFHVLEHLPQPGELFDLARAVGQRGVQLWVAVPSDRRASRRYGEPDALDAPPHHLTRWTPAALQALGDRQGWRLLSVQYEPLPWRLQVWEAGRRSPSVGVLAHWPLRRLLSRAAALAVWISGRHRMRGASGFSMLARFTPHP